MTDAPIMDRFQLGWVYDTSDKEPAKANTIPELAQKLSHDPEKLSKAVFEFNAACNDKPFNLMALDGNATTGLKPNKTT